MGRLCLHTTKPTRLKSITSDLLPLERMIMLVFTTIVKRSPAITWVIWIALLLRHYNYLQFSFVFFLLLVYKIGHAPVKSHNLLLLVDYVHFKLFKLQISLNETSNLSQDSSLSFKLNLFRKFRINKFSKRNIIKFKFYRSFLSPHLFFFHFAVNNKSKH